MLQTLLFKKMVTIREMKNNEPIYFAENRRRLFTLFKAFGGIISVSNAR